MTPSPSASASPPSPPPLPEPSPSPLPSSSGQPSLSASFWALDGSFGQASFESGIPSPSVSSLPPPFPPPSSTGQPNASTSVPSAVPGQSSNQFSTPSQSSSGSPSTVQLLPDVLIAMKSLLVSITLDAVIFS